MGGISEYSPCLFKLVGTSPSKGEPARKDDEVVLLDSNGDERGVLRVKSINNGSPFQLICRCGAGLRVSTLNVRTSGGTFGFGIRSDWLIAFSRSTQPPDHSGRNLQPGECSPADFALGNVDPAELQMEINGDGSLPGSNLYPWEKSAKDANVDDWKRLTKLEEYLKDPTNYWSFDLSDTGEAYLWVVSAKYWRPEFYRGPEVRPIDSKQRTNKDNPYVMVPKKP